MSAEAPISVRLLTVGDWPVVTELFGPNGACGGCWCMYWRLPRGGQLWEERKGEPNRRAFQRLVKTGKVHGCLAFAGEEPIGWCCVGPREDFPRLETVRALPKQSAPDTWSVVCFYIKAAWRERGVAGRLLERAVALARDHGAGRIEGYPVRHSKRAARIPAAFAWTGVSEIFEAGGFERKLLRGASRDLYTRGLRQVARKRKP